MAVLLGQAGVTCVLVARRGDRLQEIADRYSNFEVLEADLTTDEGCARVVARIADAQRPIDSDPFCKCRFSFLRSIYFLGLN